MTASTPSIDSTSRADLVALMLRLTLGAVLLAHGLLKLVVFGLPGTAAFFASIGFPGWTAYAVAPFETIVGAALIAGLGSRAFAVAALPVLAGAALVHAGNGWLFSNAGGGWEFPAVLLALSLAVAVAGDGAWTVRRLLPGGPAPRIARA
ncbi:MAG TPA: DoxX family protein [Burkholderiaceae bacterium]|nr:DoxX family protein [Burkholderiaceae bacterium]